MGRGHRSQTIVLGLVAPVTLVALAGCRVAIVEGLAKEQADEVAAGLQAASIATRLRPERGPRGERMFRVEVGRDDASKAVRELRQRELPRALHAGFEELYGEPGWVETPREERARWAAAQAGELARTLEAMRGIVRARVHLGLPDAPLQALDRPPGEPVVSVWLRVERGAEPEREAVRSLLRGSIPGLRDENVHVVVEAADPPGRHPPLLEAVGPWLVVADAAPGLRLVLAGLLVFNALLAALLVALRLRARARSGH